MGAIPGKREKEGKTVKQVQEKLVIEMEIKPGRNVRGSWDRQDIHWVLSRKTELCALETFMLVGRTVHLRVQLVAAAPGGTEGSPGVEWRTGDLWIPGQTGEVKGQSSKDTASRI